MTTEKEYVLPDYTEKFIDVYLAELDYIKTRRDKIGLPSESIGQELAELQKKLENCDDARELLPRTTPRLVGLALSGGGIRSATFNLGLLQALAKRKVLQYCDYLSTVSGGGYIGSCLSSLLANTPEASTKPAEFPLREQLERGTECKEVNHLRATKNYLGLNTGLFNADNWHAIGLNISAKLLLDAIPIALIVLFALFLYRIETIIHDMTLWGWVNDWLSASSYGDFWDGLTEGKPPKINLTTVITTIAILTALWVVVIRYGQVWWFGYSTFQARQRSGPRIARWTMLATALGVIVILFNSIYAKAWHMMLATEDDTFFDFEHVIMFLIVVSLAVILGGLLSLYKTQTRQRLLQIILSVALILFLITLPVALLAVVYKVEFDLQTSHLTAHTCESQPKVNKVNCIEFVKPEVERLFIEGEGFLIDVLNALEAPGSAAALGDMKTSLIQTIRETRADNRIRKNITTIMLISSAFFLLIGVLTNINYNSLHYFYRDRLSKTFLIRRLHDTIEPNYNCLLRKLHQHYNGPYHLVNATLNIPSSGNLSLQGRGTDFFVFSKFYCGAESTGYRNTQNYEGGHTELATAMAISGAAASPAMGTSTNSFLAVTMTLLNYRLHQWLPNPNPKKVSRVTFWPGYLFKELLRQGDEHDSRLNLSDGGHHENLGVYQLLKRRCRIIIASDAGADPHFEMTDLANLQRKARIDLGIEIQLHGREKLRLNRHRRTQRHFIVGKIIYPEGTTGLLLYLKATVTGSECEDLLAYQRTNSDFPHQSTANQFFDEDQFESYRRLGQSIGEEVFTKGVENVEELEELLEKVFKDDGGCS